MITFTERQLKNFHRKIAPPNESGCMNWIGAINESGYGQFLVGRKVKLAHRIALELSGISIPTGLYVLHSCVGNPACVNPAHLRAGTQTENMRDMVGQGRHWTTTSPEKLPRGKSHFSYKNPERVRRGETHHYSKLTDAQVIQLRHFKYTGLSLNKIGAIFGISAPQVCIIFSGKSRKIHLEQNRLAS